jgi:hypothetical protein
MLMANYDPTYRWSGKLPATSGSLTASMTVTGDTSLLPSHSPIRPSTKPLLPSAGLNTDVFRFWGDGAAVLPLPAPFPDVPTLHPCRINGSLAAPVPQYARAIFVYKTMSVID